MRRNISGNRWGMGYQTCIVSEWICIGSKYKTVFSNRSQLKKDILEHSVLTQVKLQSMLSPLLEETGDVLVIYHINEKQNECVFISINEH